MLSGGRVRRLFLVVSVRKLFPGDRIGRLFPGGRMGMLFPEGRMRGLLPGGEDEKPVTRGTVRRHFPWGRKEFHSREKSE